jgi:imidazolonepropionase-like amidohydrolase
MSIAASPDQARRFVAYWAAEGATWVKFYTDISRASMKAAIDEAHKQGIKATGHLCSVTFQEAIDLGIDDFAHNVLTASDFIADKQPDKCPSNLYKQLDSLVSGDSPLATSLIQSMISHKVSMTTTMAIYEALSPGRPVQDERSLELMTPVVRAAYVKNRAYIDSMPGYMFTKDGFARALAFDKAFYAAGGIMASGVDPTGNGGALPGFGDQRGYELLRESGLTAEQAVQVVSFNGARILGVDSKLGSVEKGKIADLVLLRGDLVADPSVIRNVVTVYKDGVAYDPTKLIDAVRGRVGVD